MEKQTFTAPPGSSVTIRNTTDKALRVTIECPNVPAKFTAELVIGAACSIWPPAGDVMVSYAEIDDVQVQGEPTTNVTLIKH